MNCRRSEELWSDYVDGALSPPLDQELRAHLDSCAECSALFRTFEEVVNALPAIEVPVPSDDLSQRVLDRSEPRLTQARQEAQRFSPAAPAGWTHAAGWLAAAAVVTLVLLWRPPQALSDWSRRASQTAHQAYSFGVRTYHQGERLLEELNVLRMTVGVAFEDRLDRLNERLQDLEEASRKTGDEEQDQSRKDLPPSNRSAHFQPSHHKVRSLL